MSYQFPPDIERLVQQQMASGQYVSENALLVDALHALAERNADLAAVQESLDDMRAGDSGRPLGEIADEIRQKHNWSAS